MFPLNLYTELGLTVFCGIFDPFPQTVDCHLGYFLVNVHLEAIEFAQISNKININWLQKTVKRSTQIYAIIWLFLLSSCGNQRVQRCHVTAENSEP